jgi:hypothetical protein
MSQEHPKERPRIFPTRWPRYLIVSVILIADSALAIAANVIVRVLN